MPTNITIYVRKDGYAGLRQMSFNKPDGNTLPTSEALEHGYASDGNAYVMGGIALKDLANKQLALQEWLMSHDLEPEFV